MCGALGRVWASQRKIFCQATNTFRSRGGAASYAAPHRLAKVRIGRLAACNKVSSLPLASDHHHSRVHAWKRDGWETLRLFSREILIFSLGTPPQGQQCSPAAGGGFTSRVLPTVSGFGLASVDRTAISCSRAAARFQNQPYRLHGPEMQARAWFPANAPGIHVAARLRSNG
jgi:hypothetical protein